MTSDIFDPSMQSNHYLPGESAELSLGEVCKTAEQSVGSFTEGSSPNLLPMNVSYSMIGVPGAIALSAGTVESWSISFGSNGIQTDVNYADAPKTPPTQDYLNNKLHTQFHYSTMNRY
jgi:hypothetical protein